MARYRCQNTCWNVFIYQGISWFLCDVIAIPVNWHIHTGILIEIACYPCLIQACYPCQTKEVLVGFQWRAFPGQVFNLCLSLPGNAAWHLLVLVMLVVMASTQMLVINILSTQRWLLQTIPQSPSTSPRHVVTEQHGNVSSFVGDAATIVAWLKNIWKIYMIYLYF